MKRIIWSAFLLLTGMGIAIAGPDNIAPLAKVTASTTLDSRHSPECVNDALIGVHNKGEWVCKGQTIMWGYIRYPWIQLDWETSQTIDKIILYDRPSLQEHTAGGTLFFSDGSQIAVNSIPNNGRRRNADQIILFIILSFWRIDIEFVNYPFDK